MEFREPIYVLQLNENNHIVCRFTTVIMVVTLGATYPVDNACGEPIRTSGNLIIYKVQKLLHYTVATLTLR